MPRDADDDHGHEHRAGDEEVSASKSRLDAVEDGTNLQTDEDEGEDVQHEHRRLPHRVRRDSDSRRCSLRRAPRHCHGVTHHRQDGRQASSIGEDPHAEGARELEDDRGRHVLYVTDQAQEQPAECWPHDHTAGDGEHERWRDSLNGEAVRRYCAYRESIEQQCACVVQQALALEDCQNALRRS